MATRVKLAVLLAFSVAIVTFGTVFALEGEQNGPLPACAGPGISGTVVAVDESTGEVTVFTDEGTLCTVLLGDGLYDHPIVALLGQYFDDVNEENLQEALTVTVGCAIEDDDPNSSAWVWVDCETQGAISVTVTQLGSGGVFSATATISDTLVVNSLIVSDTMTAEFLAEALSVLMIQWGLNPDGTVTEADDKIAAYHEEGMGFGVLTKLFMMANESQEACQNLPAEALTEQGIACGVSVDELVALFRDDGVGMGQLFKEFGKPSMLGVGHIRKALLGEGKAKLHKGGPKVNKGKGGPPVEDDALGTGEASEEIDQAPNDKHGRPDKDKKDKGQGHGNGRGGQNGHRGPPKEKKDKKNK